MCAALEEPILRHGVSLLDSVARYRGVEIYSPSLETTASTVNIPRPENKIHLLAEHYIPVGTQR